MKSISFRYASILTVATTASGVLCSILYAVAIEQHLTARWQDHLWQGLVGGVSGLWIAGLAMGIGILVRRKARRPSRTWVSAAVGATGIVAFLAFRIAAGLHGAIGALWLALRPWTIVLLALSGFLVGIGLGPAQGREPKAAE